MPAIPEHIWNTVEGWCAIQNKTANSYVIEVNI